MALFNLQGSKLSGGAFSTGNTQDLAISGSLFQGNTTGPSSTGGLGNGGAVDIADSAAVTVSGNVFQNNIADSGPTGGLGGALHLKHVDDLLVEQNTFAHNRAGTAAGIGGALALEAAGNGVQWWPNTPALVQIAAQTSVNERVAIRRNTFLDNDAATNSVNDAVDLGGALAVNGTNGLELTNNVVAGNGATHGGAMALLGWDSSSFTGAIANAAITNNSFFNNAGDSGIYAEMWTTPLTFTNNIVVSHTVGIYLATNVDLGGTRAGAYYNLYYGNGTDSETDPDSALLEANRITGAPGFVEAWANDFHLLPTSIAAIDAGDPLGVPPAPPVDIENVQRPFGTHVDVGAYEWHGPRTICQVSTGTRAKRSAVKAGRSARARRPNATIILHTANGVTWARQYTSTVRLTGLAVVDAQNLWVTGEDASILRSVDGGSTWQKQPAPATLPPTADINVISAVDGKTAWAVAIAGPAQRRSQGLQA